MAFLSFKFLSAFRFVIIAGCIAMDGALAMPALVATNARSVTRLIDSFGVLILMGNLIVGMTAKRFILRVKFFGLCAFWGSLAT